MEFVLFLIAIILGILVLFYIDQKLEYREIPITLWTRENGEFYFAVNYYFWQIKKLQEAKRIYKQNTLVTFEGFTYRITKYGGIYPATNGYFFERELRYFGHTLSEQEKIEQINFIINQYGDGTISVDLSSKVIQNEVIAIENYLSQDTNINAREKEAIEIFLDKVKNQQPIKKEELNTVYHIFLKYEPLASFCINLFSSIQNLFKV